MFMRYRGGRICHTYMREIENRFEEMRLDWAGLEEIPQSTWAPRVIDSSTEGSLNSAAKAVTPVQNFSVVDSGDEDMDEGEDSEDEWLGIDHSGEDDYFYRVNSDDEEDDNDSDGGDGDSGDSDDDDDDDDDDDEIYQGTYGMSEY